MPARASIKVTSVGKIMDQRGPLLASVPKEKLLVTYCVPLLRSTRYIDDVKAFRSSWIENNVSRLVSQKYDLTFLVVFKTDDLIKHSLTSEEAFRSIGIEDFGIKHISTFHPNI